MVRVPNIIVLQDPTDFVDPDAGLSFVGVLSSAELYVDDSWLSLRSLLRIRKVSLSQDLLSTGYTTIGSSLWIIISIFYLLKVARSYVTVNADHLCMFLLIMMESGK